MCAGRGVSMCVNMLMCSWAAPHGLAIASFSHWLPAGCRPYNQFFPKGFGVDLRIAEGIWGGIDAPVQVLRLQR